MKDLLCKRLSQEIRDFTRDSFEEELSMFARLKIFTAAYLHMRRSYALFVGPDYSYGNEKREICDLWGLAFCKTSNHQSLLGHNTEFIQGVKKTDFETCWTENCDLGDSIYSRAVFTLFSKGENDDENKSCEECLRNFFSKETHHILSWDKYVLWWRLNDIPNIPQTQDKNLRDDYISTIYQKFANKPFYDPFKINFDSRYVLSNIKEREFLYKLSSLQIPTSYFEEGKAFRGATKMNLLPKHNNYKKRKLVIYPNKNVAICGTSGISVLLGEKNKVLCNPNQSDYQVMLAEKFCDKINENTARNYIDIKGTWLAVHLQNNVISHFIFEVLKPVLFVARITRFNLLLTGVKPAPHILEFFTTNSALKDRIIDIATADPNCMYRPEKTLLLFESHREISPEDACNLQWFGESIIERHRDKKNYAENIYISRLDSPASRSIINEFDFIQFLEANGYKTFRFDKLTLIEKLKTIKYAKEIVAVAGSGLLFRNFLATHNNVRIVMSGSFIWNDLSLFLRGASLRNETLFVFKSEKSLGSEIFPFARNHASFSIPLSCFSQSIKYEPDPVSYVFLDNKGGIYPIPNDSFTN